ncbi:hypothetical protein CLNEO_13290 [Anaerotignum neopropionicum]|uniref:DUF3892 domain-containing protein n=1 Tax=Anaerotignum neopropionicum TaxID=36847 RepID=A0A136WFM7_9FIRM|nr:DUF3892 domain-containing protein [Anaerotignum neopropionicum]KXL53358.1 hypothetical protein CLNEO_13290 [Anaerotignum neopropionicum]
MAFTLEKNELTEALAKNTLDDIPSANPNAQKITGLVKKSGKVKGYRLSDDTIVEKKDAIKLARQGGIAGVGIAHRGDTEYLKSIPDGTEDNNLSHLPTVSVDPATK